jgi:hypothetical protein
MATKKASTPKKSKKIEAPPGSPERVVRFFEEELADYEGRAAHGMEYFSSESKLTLRFSPQGAADVLETYGEDLPETRAETDCVFLDDAGLDVCAARTGVDVARA